MLIHASVRDASLEVRRALDAMRLTGDTLLEFEPGTYEFRPESAAERCSCVSNHDNDGFKQIGIPLWDMRGITVDGCGSKFIFRDVMLPCEVFRCEDITLRNFSVDYPVPHYAQTECVAAGEDFVTFRPWACSPYLTDNRRLYFVTDRGRRHMPRFFLIVDPATGTYREGTSRVPVGDMEACGEEGGLVTLRGQKLLCVPKPGDTLCFKLSERYAPGIFIESSKNVTLRDVTLHHALGMGVLAQVSENITLERVNMLPSEGRYMSVCDDGAHFVSCRGQVTLRDCDFEKHFDDTLNIHGIYMRIEEKAPDGVTVLGRLVHSQQLGVDLLHPGERVAFIGRKTLLPVGENRVASVRAVSRSLFAVTFEQPLGENVREKDCIESLDAAPGLTVTGCRFFAAFPRGLLITTRGKVRVENNYFRVASAAIHISGDANQWFESGAVRDVLIRHNTFDRCGIIGPALSQNYTVINVLPQTQEADPGAGYYHDNIRVIGNRFITAIPELLKVRSTDRVEFRDNTVERG